MEKPLQIAGQAIFAEYCGILHTAKIPQSPSAHAFWRAFLSCLRTFGSAKSCRLNEGGVPWKKGALEQRKGGMCANISSARKKPPGPPFLK
jgi:hypothetical protein